MTSSLRVRKRRLSEGDSDSPLPKRPRGMGGGRFHAVSDSFCGTTAPEWFNLDHTFQLPESASVQPLESPPFDVDFCNLPSLPTCIPLAPGEHTRPQQTFGLLTTTFKALPPDNPALTDEFSGLFEIPQADSLQATLPFGPDWTEFLNFGPELSLFPPSPSLISSLASTPPLADDALLSPCCGNTPSTGPVPDALPLLSRQKVQPSVIRCPMIQESGFLLPLGENPGDRKAHV